jgi:hypothetical protein
MQMFYAHVDSNNKLLGWYTPEIHGDNIPTPNVEVTKDRWQEILNDSHCYVYSDGTSAPANKSIETK